MDEEIAKQIEAAFPPETAGFDWGVELSFYILQELESRHPGFRKAVQERVLHAATMVEGDDPKETAELRDDMAQLAASWIFRS